MSGAGAAPNDPAEMRAWLNGEPAHAVFKDGVVTITGGAHANVAGPGVILTGGVMTVDPKYISGFTGAAIMPIAVQHDLTVSHPPAFLPGECAAPCKTKRSPPTVAYVVASPQEAKLLRTKLDLVNGTCDVWVMHVGGSVIGRRFSTILVTREAHDTRFVGTVKEIKRANAWFLEQCQTRLLPNGVMVRL